jgi:hypothetical protein
MSEQDGRIYWIGGSKGGVGKSMLTMSLLDYVLDRGDKVLIAEFDTSNPDVWKADKDLVPVDPMDRNEADGSIRLVNTCNIHRDSRFVVNTAARNNISVKHSGKTLDGSLEELGTRLVVLWIINRQRDSLSS